MVSAEKFRCEDPAKTLPREGYVPSASRRFTSATLGTPQAFLRTLHSTVRRSFPLMRLVTSRSCRGVVRRLLLGLPGRSVRTLHQTVRRSFRFLEGLMPYSLNHSRNLEEPRPHQVIALAAATWGG